MVNNFVSWNDRSPKYNIRGWAPAYEKMRKRITLTEDETRSLYQILGEALSNSES